MIPNTPEAYQLMHEGTLCFAEMEANGMLIDVPYLDKALDETKAIIRDREERVRSHAMFTDWQKHFGQETNLDSGTQLAHILYTVMGLPVTDWTQARKPSTDEDALEKINLPFVADYLEYKKYGKLRNTYLTGIRREVCPDGRLRPFFHLAGSDDKEGGATTYRSSSSDPNLHNVPIRDPEIGPIIRRAFIAPPGWRIVETDESGAEVRAACGYHKDPTMIRYVKDGYDMHEDMAVECFMLGGKELYKASPETKKILKANRQAAKGDFTFASFYGSYHKKVARALWDDIRKYKLKNEADESLYTHLKNRGVTGLGECADKKDPVPGTFEHHIKQVEERFWRDRFPVYARWREDIVKEYRAKGYMRTLTGFLISGPQSRNFIFNAPVQGSAFHWLLYAATQIRREVHKCHMRAQLCNQIHDSLISLVPEEECDDYTELATRWMTEGVRQRWDWVNVPLVAETDWSPLGGNWYDKQPYHKAA